ncbi:hypothetical protein BDV97DRAFT_358302 [Delphinella strobiligena]|nr:hypothetical protein BDV97DRAFT_358302 [Delphinella strobiligena]
MAPIPKGSTVLVTGSNGYLASHVVDQLLAADYKVKGTVRSEQKGEWLTKYFSEKYGAKKFELVIIPDLSKQDALTDALKGCSGIAHVASDLSFSPKAEDVIPGVVANVNNVLKSAAKESSIKRFILTSSSAASVFPIPEKKFQITKDSWNEHSVEQAWKKEGVEGQGYHVYCASKVAGEQALWKFMNDKKSAFEANAVLPNYIMGKILGREFGQSGSTAGAIVNIYAEKGEKYDAAMGMLNMVPPQWMVNVGDTARLHVAALTDPEIVSERVFAFAETYNNNEILAALRKLRPGHKFPSDFEDNRHDLSEVVQRKRADEILKKHYGRGFRGLEESIKESLEGL